MSHTTFYPEMGQTTDAEIVFTVSTGGGYYLTTDLELSGRGITKSGDGSDHRRGKKTYRCTELALAKLKAKYSTAYMATL